MVCDYAEVNYELIDEVKAIYENIQSSDYFNALTELSKNYIEARIHLLAHTLSEDYLDDLKVEDSLKNQMLTRSISLLSLTKMLILLQIEQIIKGIHCRERMDMTTLKTEFPNMNRILPLSIFIKLTGVMKNALLMPRGTLYGNFPWCRLSSTTGSCISIILKNRLKKHFHRSAFILNSKLYTIPSCLFSFSSQKTLSFQIRAPSFVHQSISHHRTSLLAQRSVIFCITLIQ